MQRKSEAIVLRTHKYSETSLIIRAYSLEEGKISLMGKGVRQSKAKKGPGMLHPGAHLQLVYQWKANRDLHTLTDYSSLSTRLALLTDPLRMLYLNLGLELFDAAVLEEEPQPLLFQTLNDWLIGLSEPGEVTYFEPFIDFWLEIWNHQGFLPEVEIPGSELPSSWGWELNSREGALRPSPQPDPAASLLANRLLAMHQQQTTPIPKSNKKRFVEMLLAYQLQHCPGMLPPKSLEVFQAVFR
jgi:DNA repair protein RecO (recombination protein O)